MVLICLKQATKTSFLISSKTSQQTRRTQGRRGRNMKKHRPTPAWATMGHPPPPHAHLLTPAAGLRTRNTRPHKISDNTNCVCVLCMRIHNTHTQQFAHIRRRRRPAPDVRPRPLRPVALPPTLPRPQGAVNLRPCFHPFEHVLFGPDVKRDMGDFFLRFHMHLSAPHRWQGHFLRP